MKKIFALLRILLTVAFNVCSCEGQSDEAASNENYLRTITELENELALLKQEQNTKNSESEKRIAELTERLNALGKESETDNNKEESTEAPFTGFKYSVSGNEAAITGYCGEEKNIVIPTTVDGYRVTSVADNAFEDMPITSVIISDGVVSIGWFAFNGCTELTSVMIPASVTSIGYSALGVAGAPLTVYCHSGSYALSYAKSFGLTYTVI